MTEAAQISTFHGIVSVVIGFGLPFVFWSLLLKNFKPKTRLKYALKFSLWPIIVSTFMLGGPISRELIFRIESSHTISLLETTAGIIGLFIITGPIFFIIGYLKGKKKFKKN
jgi:hypothetical protein